MTVLELKTMANAVAGLACAGLHYVGESLPRAYFKFIVSSTGLVGVFEFELVEGDGTGILRLIERSIVDGSITVRVGAEQYARGVTYVDDCLACLADGSWLPVGIDRDDYCHPGLLDGETGAGTVASGATGAGIAGYEPVPTRL